MIDRRTLIASGIALGAANTSWASELPYAKHRAIDAIQLPHGFAGALAYGRDGKVLTARISGWADAETGQAILPDTQFKWGWASKWLVSVAVLRLVAAGRMSLDAPITAYLPDFRPDTGRRVHIEHLLSNTSGIPDLLTRQLATEPSLRTSTASAASIVARFGGGDLAFAPGQGWDYAALNWVILCAILERLSGEPLPKLVERLVLRPLGLFKTGFDQAGQPDMPALAAAYATVTPPVRKMAGVPPFLAASGNVASTVQDAVRAAHGIFHGRLLRPAARQQLTRIRWSEQEYALGGRVHAIDGSPWAWETGKVQGYRALIAHRLAHSETVVIFNTTDLEQSVIAGWVEAIARA